MRRTVHRVLRYSLQPPISILTPAMVAQSVDTANLLVYLDEAPGDRCEKQRSLTLAWSAHEFGPATAGPNLKRSRGELRSHRERHYRLLRMETVFRLVEDPAPTTVDYLVGNLDVAICRERVHIDGVLIGHFHAPRIDDPV